MGLKYLISWFLACVACCHYSAINCPFSDCFVSSRWSMRMLWSVFLMETQLEFLNTWFHSMTLTEFCVKPYICHKVKKYCLWIHIVKTWRLADWHDYSIRLLSKTINKIVRARGMASLYSRSYYINCSLRSLWHWIKKREALTAERCRVSKDKLGHGPQLN